MATADGGSRAMTDTTAAERMRRMRARKKAASASPILYEQQDWRDFINRASLPRKAGCEPNQLSRVVLKELVDNALDALRALCNLPAAQCPPTWLEPAEWDATELIACRNGLLHVPTRQVLEPTPLFFSLNGIEFDFDPHAPAPENWLKFL